MLQSTLSLLFTALLLLPLQAPPVPPIGPQVAPRRYADQTIDALARRDFGEGSLRVEETLAATNAFTRSLVSWQSDGLTVHGFMNVPGGEGPFPVVIVNHGYVDPAIYSTLTYTTRYADALARAGFLVIHPSFRGYPPSDDGPNPLRAGFAVDVLDLIAIVQREAGRPGPFEQADGARIGLWGHSMGGGVSLRVLAVAAARDLLRGVEEPTVDGAILYGAMSGDETRNHERILNVFSGGTRGSWEEGEAPSQSELPRINPLQNLAPLQSAVSIHHGEFDDQVPPEWSAELCGILQDAAKNVECFVYAGQPHTFVGEGDTLFMNRSVDFFNRIFSVAADAE